MKKEPSLTDMEPQATHLPMLMLALNRVTRGDVLELGCGDYSTPILHYACQGQGRLLYSLDSNAEWLRKFLPLGSPAHVFEHAQDWDAVRCINQEWGVALVDHEPAARRGIELKRLAQCARVVVAHDVEDQRSYNYDFSMYRYVHIDRTHRAHTALLSNFVDVARWIL